MNIGGKTFNTMFIIHFLKNQLNKKIYNTIDNDEYKSFFEKYESYNNSLYYLEEGIYDFLFLKNEINNSNSCFLKETGIVLKYFRH